MVYIKHLLLRDLCSFIYFFTFLSFGVLYSHQMSFAPTMWVFLFCFNTHFVLNFSYIYM